MRFVEVLPLKRCLVCGTTDIRHKRMRLRKSKDTVEIECLCKKCMKEVTIR